LYYSNLIFFELMWPQLGSPTGLAITITCQGVTMSCPS
jgi:hypothetical protein